LNQRLLKSVEIPLPPLPEQQKIAEILETVDNVIEKTDAIIEKYKRIKQGLMQDLLTRGIVMNYELGIMNYGSELRKHESGIMNDELGVGSHESEIGNWELRDERKHKFKDSLLGKIPEEWEVVRLGEVFTIFAGRDLEKETFSEIETLNHKYPIYSNSLEKNGLYGYSTRYRFPEGCITVTGRGSLGYAIPRYEKFDAIIRLLVLQPKYELDIKYVAEYINNKINIFVESTGVPQLTAPHIATYKVPLPPLPEQRRIASILSQVDEVIEKEQKYKEKLERIKRGLMKDLLTGRIRVNSLIEHGYIENGK